jgi:hypothetical protein
MKYYIESDPITTHREVVTEKRGPLGFLEFEYQNANLYPVIKSALKKCHYASFADKHGMREFWFSRAWKIAKWTEKRYGITLFH